MNRVQAERLLRGGPAGIERWNAAVRDGAPLPDLGHLDLQEARLLGADLRGADLGGARLRNATLIDAVLRKADLSDADLEGANLGCASLHAANLADANLDGASLRAAQAATASFARANLASATLVQADLRRATFVSAQLGSAVLADADLSHANLRDVGAKGAIFSNSELASAQIEGSNLKGASLSGACLTDASLRGCDLTGANLRGARLQRADLRDAVLRGAVLAGTDISEADLTGADLTGADLSNCRAVGTCFKDATLTHCRIFGISTWDMNLEGAAQSSLVITRAEQPTITADNVEIAQFLYMLINHHAVRDILDTVSSKIVLILGRFTMERKAVLDDLHEALRKRDYLPILFDFDKPVTRDLTETVSTLAHLSRFIIADLTDPSSVPHELASLIPGLPSVPVQPILHASAGEAYGMFEHWKRYPWVLKTFQYRDGGHALSALDRHVVAPAEAYLEIMRPPKVPPHE